MDTRIRHQSTGPPHLVGQLTKLLIGRGNHAQLFAELLGVQTPTLHKGCVIKVSSELRPVSKFLAKRNLQMVSRDAFLQGKSRDFVQGSLIEVRQIDRQGSRNPALWTTAFVIASCLAFFRRSRNGFHAVGQPRQTSEQAG